MNRQEIDLRNQAKLALFTAKSIKDAELAVFKFRGKRQMKLTRNDNSNHLRAVLPQTVSGKDVVNQLPRKGLKLRRKGYRYPKAGCRSSIQVVKKSELLKAGLSEEQVAQLISMQSSRIRVKKSEISSFLAQQPRSEELIESLEIVNNELTKMQINDSLRSQLEEIATN